MVTISSGQGVRIIFHHPPSWVWYAPETLLWYAILLGAPLLVVLALKLLAYRGVGGSEDQATEELSAGPKPPPTLASYAGSSASLLAFVYSMLLFAECMAAVWFLGHRSPRGGEMLVNTIPGLAAAAALLAPVSWGLVFASLGALGAIAHYRAAVVRTGLLTVIWMFAGGFGCLIAAFLSGPSGWTVPVFWGSLGVALMLVGFWARQARFEGAPSILTLARRAEQVEHKAEAEAAAATAAPRGEYRGRSPLRYWGRVVGMFLFPPVFFGGFFLLFYLSAGSPGRLPLLDPDFMVFSFGGGALFALVAWLATARRARGAIWDEAGVEVTWYPGKAKRFAWDELASLKVTTVEKGAEGAVVVTATGAKFAILEGERQYPELLTALKAHVWGRDEAPTDSGD